MLTAIAAVGTSHCLFRVTSGWRRVAMADYLQHAFLLIVVTRPIINI